MRRSPRWRRPCRRQSRSGDGHVPCPAARGRLYGHLNVLAERGQELHQLAARDRYRTQRISADTYAWVVPSKRAAAICVILRSLRIR